MAERAKVVVMGGGTGTFMMLLALKQLPVDITALLTMVDDGGSNRILRDQFGLLPTSGVCQCIVALSKNDSLLRDLFNYRFHQGDGIRGMRFGNLFLAAVADIVGSQKEAIQQTLRLLQVEGEIYPISYDNVRLVAQYENGAEVIGEHEIDEPAHDKKLQIVGLRTEPKAQLSPEAAQAIAEADLIIFGPGDFYTNTVANFVVEGVPAAVKASRAQKLFVTNLMTKPGETYGYTLTRFLQEVDRYYGLDGVDSVLVNSNWDFPEGVLEHYGEEDSAPVYDDVQGDFYEDVKIIRADLMADEVFAPATGDTLQRSVVRHDPEKVAQAVSQVLPEILKS